MRDKNMGRRAVMKTAGALAVTAGLSGAGGSALSQTRLTPSLKSQADDGVKAQWTRLARLPFPVQEIYPSAFWNSQIANAQPTKALKAQRFNMIVNAGGIVGARGGQFTASDAMCAYDPITDRWQTTGPTLPEPCHHLHLVAHNGYLFAIGGFSTADRRDLPPNRGWRMRRDVMRLERLNGRWERMQSLPGPQAEAVCLSMGGFIHIVGGRAPAGSMNSQWSDHIDTDRHFVFDARRNEWYEVAPMSVPRNSATGVAVGGILYVMGGRQVSSGGLANVAVNEAYDPQADRWQTMAPMPIAQGGLAAAALGDTIFVFGGEYFDDKGGGVYHEAWGYDTREDKWRSAGIMPRARHGLGAVTLNDAIYVMGGATSPGGNGTSADLDRFLV